MSVISLNTPSFAVSVAEENIEMKMKIFDCLNVEGEKSEGIFDDVSLLPDSLKEFSSMLFLETDSYLPYDKETDLFLLLNQLFGDTYLVVADEWIYDEDDDDWDEDEEDEDGYDWDESGEVNGTKFVSVYVPNGLKKCTFVLSVHEMLDMGGGSNGADIDFADESGIEEEKLDNTNPSDSFVKEIFGKAKEKGYADLVDLINEKVKRMD